ncbi:MAG: hypothetical protein JW910_15185, partial [Anaerolineae bacterium]|nr:hypothetical protein [Anaerolineae bacterium]
MPRPMHRLTPVLAAALALLSGFLFVQYDAVSPDGSPALPLDDAYIHLQYGWQAAQGEFLQYNPGDAPTTGATSLLYMLVLAAGFAAGITHEAMPAVTVGAGMIAFAIAAALLADLARRAADLACERELTPVDAPPPLFPSWAVGLLAGGLFAGSGWMAWAFCSGMETGLLITLVIAVLWAFTADLPALVALLGGLAVLTRPEALILALALWGAAWRVRHWADTHTIRRVRLLWLSLPVLAAAIPFGINLIYTGTLSASGLQAKSWFSITPFYPLRVVGEILRTLVQLA